MGMVNIDPLKIPDLDYTLSRETIQCNSRGAYTISTIVDCNTRKYHGLLVAPQPQIDQDQHVLLSTLHEELIVEEKVYELATQKYPGTYAPKGYQYIKQIEVDPVPKIIYEVPGAILTKEKVLLKQEDRVLIIYTLQESKSNIALRLRPFLAFRNKHTLCQANYYLNTRSRPVDRGISYQLYPIYDELFLQLSAGNFYYHEEGYWYDNIEYDREKERGYDFREDLWVPGYFKVVLRKGESVVFSAGLEEVHPNELKNSFIAEVKKLRPWNSLEDCLHAAADQFVIKHDNKVEVVAGYPWFGRWGRDTFIALPGLTLSKGDAETCKKVLDTMVKEMDGPLFPNAGSGNQVALNTVDAPLWFFWAVQQYATFTGNVKAVWEQYGKAMKDILEGYKEGTSFNIRMLENGLIYAGEEGKALTWMDAVYQGEAFTPRIGVPVEINVLWYNAVCFSVAAAKLSNDNRFVKQWSPWIKRIKKAFVATFWDPEKRYLADYVTDSLKDWSVRPNQIFATSLPYSPIDNQKCRSILRLVKKELLTPRGLRTLTQHDNLYQGTYFGDQKTRDSAYHQGTVWPWLLGHFVEGYLKAYGSEGLDLAKSIYQGFEDTLNEHGIGTVSEIYDGGEPHQARGAISQAWSVAELLRMSQLIHQAEQP